MACPFVSQISFVIFSLLLFLFDSHPRQQWFLSRPVRQRLKGEEVCARNWRLEGALGEGTDRDIMLLPTGQYEDVLELPCRYLHLPVGL